MITDRDGAAADAIVAEVNPLHEQDPAARILPAPDHKAWIRAFSAGPLDDRRWAGGM